MKCNICGKEIEGWGNNPYPICDKEDYNSKCCNDCNDDYVLGARILNMRYDLNDIHKDIKIGDEITIFWLHDTPNFKDYIFRKGTIEEIDNQNNLYGTWGNITISPEKDVFIISNEV